MVAIKANQVSSFLKSIDRSISAILVFGPDTGLVSERAREAAERLAARDNPPGELIRIEDADLENDPDRLSVELQTIPMFGGPKVIRTTASRRVNANLLKPLVQSGNLAGVIVVEAGNLKPDDALRIAFEKSPGAAAIPCYADEGRDLDGLITTALRDLKLDITPDARQALAARLGADRALSRGEIEKLALYVGAGTITTDDVDAIVGDASQLTIDRILNAAISGHGAAAVLELERAAAAGESPQGIILALQRNLQRLHRVRASMDAGRTLEDVIRSLRPPLHFKAKDIFVAQVRNWTLPRLAAALERSAEAAKLARISGSLETTLAERLLLDISARAKAARRS